MSAYFLGWWTADGYFDKKLKSIAICSTDKQLIDDLAFRVNYNKKIKVDKRSKGKPGYRIQFFGDVPLRISELGYKPGPKGGTEFIPEFIKNDTGLFFSWLRGFIDGDGTIRPVPQFKDKNGIPNLWVSMCNLSKTMLQDIWHKLKGLNIVLGGQLPHTNATRPTYVLSFGHQDSVRICEKLYENATIKLDRKYRNYISCKDREILKVPIIGKVCKVCGEPSISKDLCEKHYVKEYRALNKEKIFERRKRYRENNKEKIREQKREYRQKNLERIREKDCKYREGRKEQMKEYKHNWYLKKKAEKEDAGTSA